MSKEIFFLSSGRLVLYRWNKGHFDDPLIFRADEHGLADFGLYLQHRANVPAYLLVDFVEEEFREDSIPHVLGMDRRALVQNKQNRLFRNPTYAHALFQGRQAVGRRDDNVLFTALIRPDLITPWMTPIVEAKLPLAGIYSLPLISDYLLKTLNVESSRALLVSLQSAGGLRQTFFLNGQLKLSRLATMPQVQERGYASYVLSEVEKIRRYLNSLRMLPHDTPLDVFLLGDSKLLSDMGQQSTDADNVRHHLYDLADIAQRLKIKDEYNSRYADRIFAHILARRAPANQYATKEQTRYHIMHRARGGLRVASLTLLLGSAVWGGVKFVQGVGAAQETVAVENQTRFYNDRYLRARSRLPETPAEPQDMQQAVELAGDIREAKTWPYPMLAVISEGLRQYPSVRIEQLLWKSSTDPSVPVGRPDTGRPVSQIVPGADRRRRGVGPSAENLFQLALIKGSIHPFSGDFRAALNMVRSFADTLRQQPSVSEVQVIALPLDIGSEKRLSGTATNEVLPVQAPFEIRVVLLERAIGSG